jgi:hypothetical protein
VHKTGQGKKGIIHQKKTYTVQYGENDEQSLVQMQNLDLKGSAPRSPRSLRSEFSK